MRVYKGAQSLQGLAGEEVCFLSLWGERQQLFPLRLWEKSNLSCWDGMDSTDILEEA